MTGLLWNLTFAITTENVCAGESGHSQVAITALGKVPAERLHPKAAYSRYRPLCIAGIVAPSSERRVAPMGGSGRSVELVTEPDDPIVSQRVV